MARVSCREPVTSSANGDEVAYASGVRIAVACVVLAAGCDRLFFLDRLPEPPRDAVTDSHDDAVARGDAISGDAPDALASDCTIDFTFNPVTQSYYKLVNQSLSWTEARTACKSVPSSGEWYSHLLVINSAVEYGQVFGMPEVQSRTPWAGAFDYNTNDGQSLFRFVTTQPGTHFMWGNLQPDMPDTQNCARLWVPEGMDDETCSQTFWFVCECDQYPDS